MYGFIREVRMIPSHLASKDSSRRWKTAWKEHQKNLFRPLLVKIARFFLPCAPMAKNKRSIIFVAKPNK